MATPKDERDLIATMRRRFERAQAARSGWESAWQDCYEFALPPAQAGLQGAGSAFSAPALSSRLFDGTAPDAVDQLAASLLARLTPPWSRWFGLTAGRDLTPDEQQKVGPELEAIADALQTHFDRSNFAVEIHQCYLDLAAAGTACLLFEEAPIGADSAFRFTAVPLAEAWLEESAEGRLDTVFRRTSLPGEAFRRRFPDAELDPETRRRIDAGEELHIDVIEAVLPDGEDGYRYLALRDGGTMAAAPADDAPLAEGRFRRSPFIAFRWLKAPGEAYGRSPVMKALPDIVICDDVEVPGNSGTPAKRAALREKLGEIEFVLVPDGTQLYLGTPHSYYSIYAERARTESGEARPFLDGFDRAVFPVENARGRAAWPQRFPKRAIEAARRGAGPLKFASQMMLTPTAPEGCRLDAAKLLRYAGEVEYREAQGRGSLWLEDRKLASVRVWWDPAYGRTEKASRNVIAVVYQDETGGYWLHRVHYFAPDAALAARDPELHAEADQLCREAARFVHELGAPAITVEDNGIGKFVPGLLRKALSALGSPVAVIGHHSRTPKDERILAAFDVTLAAGLLHAQAGVCDGPFLEELREWQPLA